MIGTWRKHIPTGHVGQVLSVREADAQIKLLTTNDRLYWVACDETEAAAMPSWVAVGNRYWDQPSVTRQPATTGWDIVAEGATIDEARDAWFARRDVEVAREKAEYEADLNMRAIREAAWAKTATLEEWKERLRAMDEALENW